MAATVCCDGIAPRGLFTNSQSWKGCRPLRSAHWRRRFARTGPETSGSVFTSADWRDIVTAGLHSSRKPMAHHKASSANFISTQMGACGWVPRSVDLAVSTVPPQIILEFGRTQLRRGCRATLWNASQKITGAGSMRERAEVSTGWIPEAAPYGAMAVRMGYRLVR